MSEIARDEIEGVIERLVDEYTPGDVLEDWDLAELETQLRQIWPVSVEVGSLAPETVDREKLKDDLDDDAMNAYDEREEQLGEELMRYLERSILLQVIDNRWREHLYDMDYLREGIHLRGFAQIDPLVAYKNEGFAMFEELMHSIWEEFSKLVFHAEVEVDPAQAQQALRPATAATPPTALDYSGGTPEAQPSALQQVAAAGGAGAVDVAAGDRRPATAAEVVETVVKDEHDNIGRNDPCWCGVGQEVQEVPRGLSARMMPDPVREFIRAFNERDLDAFVAVLDPEVELHARGGCARGSRRRGSGRRGRPAGCSRRSSWRSSTRTSTEAGGGRAVALIRRVWHWDEDGSHAGRGRDGLALRAARAADPQLAPLRGPRRGAARVGFEAYHRAAMGRAAGRRESRGD